MQTCTHTVQLRKPSCMCIWQILSASSSASLLCCACSHNCLKALVPEVWSLSSLKSLKLDHNQLTIVPEEIGNLKRLEELVSMPVVCSCMQAYMHFMWLCVLQVLHHKSHIWCDMGDSCCIHPFLLCVYFYWKCLHCTFMQYRCTCGECSLCVPSVVLLCCVHNTVTYVCTHALSMYDANDVCTMCCVVLCCVDGARVTHTYIVSCPVVMRIVHPSSVNV